jgi:hypothetical protein
VHEEIGRRVPRGELGLADAAGELDPRAEAGGVDRAGDPRAERPIADQRPAPPPGAAGAVLQLAERGGQHVEALVLLEPADADEQALVGGQSEPRPQGCRGTGRCRARVIDALQVHGIGHDVDARRIDRQMRADRRDQCVVGGEHRLGGAGTGPHGRLQRCVGEPLQAREAGMRAAELLQALRIEHERRTCVGAAMRQRVAEPAGAEGVHEIDVAAADQVGGDAAGPPAEDGVSGSAIDHRGAAPSGAGEGHVRHGAQPDPAGWRGEQRRHVTVRAERPRCRGRLGEERDRQPPPGQVVQQVVDVALEAADAVQRVDRARQDRDPERRRVSHGPACRR